VLCVCKALCLHLLQFLAFSKNLSLTLWCHALHWAKGGNSLAEKSKCSSESEHPSEDDSARRTVGLEGAPRTLSLWKSSGNAPCSEPPPLPPTVLPVTLRPAELLFFCYWSHHDLTALQQNQDFSQPGIYLSPSLGSALGALVQTLLLTSGPCNPFLASSTPHTKTSNQGVPLQDTGGSPLLGPTPTHPKAELSWGGCRKAAPLKPYFTKSFKLRLLM
jgi:hypothetical protein